MRESAQPSKLSLVHFWLTGEKKKNLNLSQKGHMYTGKAKPKGNTLWCMLLAIHPTCPHYEFWTSWQWDQNAQIKPRRARLAEKVSVGVQVKKQIFRNISRRPKWICERFFLLILRGFRAIRFNSFPACRSAGDAQPSPSLTNGRSSQVIGDQERLK